MNTILLQLLIQLAIFRIFKCQSGHFEMLLFHSNNINFHFDEDKLSGGGAARAIHVLNKYKDEWERRNGPPVLYLNAGDNFSFSRSYTVNSSELIADYLNAMKPDAVCLGNHDLNVGLDGLKQFLNRLAAPVLVSNLHFVPSTGLEELVERSRVFKLGNRTVGVVGATSSGAPIPFLPAGANIRDEVDAIQKESSILHERGVNIVIALVHSNCEMDKTIANVVEHVDVIVAGRRTSCTRTEQMKFLEVFRRQDGKYVPIVHEAGHLRYLGKIKLIFDDDGNLVTFSNDPVVLHRKITQAPEAMTVEERSKREAADNILGKCRTALSSECNNKECNYANLLADAMVEYRAEKFDQDHQTYWTDYSIAIVNSGTFRKSIRRGGGLTTRIIKNTIVYDDTLALIRITGATIKEAIVEAADWFGYTSGYFPQFSGLRVTLNMSRRGLLRVSRVTARCDKCDVPTYTELLPEEEYNVIVNQKMYEQIEAFRGKKKVEYFTVTLEMLLSNYVKKYHVVTPEVQDRLVINGSVKFTFRNVHLHIKLCIMLIVKFLYK